MDQDCMFNHKHKNIGENMLKRIWKKIKSGLD